MKERTNDAVGELTREEERLIKHFRKSDHVDIWYYDLSTNRYYLGGCVKNEAGITHGS